MDELMFQHSLKQDNQSSYLIPMSDPIEIVVVSDPNVTKLIWRWWVLFQLCSLLLLSSIKISSVLHQVPQGSRRIKKYSSCAASGVAKARLCYRMAELEEN